MNYGFDSVKIRILFVIISLVAGGFFLMNLDVVFPLARTDIKMDRKVVENSAREFLETKGFDLTGYKSSSRFQVRGTVLEYMQKEFGKEKAQRLIGSGLPVYSYNIYFKKRGSSRVYRASYTPGAGITSWYKMLKERDPGKDLTVKQARQRVREMLSSELNLNLSNYTEKGVSTYEHPKRIDHYFRYERVISKKPDLKERISVKVGGGDITSVSRRLKIPQTARERLEMLEAEPKALQTFGFIIVGLACLAAFFHFLVSIRDKRINLARSAVFPAVVMICYILQLTLSGPDLFWNWNPLWPRWISNFRYITSSLGHSLWILLILFICVGSGDSVDRREGWNRGSSLWKLVRGQIFERNVAFASLNGFLTGLVCGGVLTLSVTGLGFLAKAQTGIQPRGFYFFTLNTTNPPLSILLFFLGVALAEELGYRFFAGSWLLSFTEKKWIAIVVPGLAYGLTHTGLSFLPPSRPYWARPLVLTLIGCVWGWAFFKFDALTVILSHLTADLFIFNWCLIARGGVKEIVYSTAVFLVPLIPAILYIPAQVISKIVKPRKNH